jgi:16S rRNA (guanine966-N2)-methyltransferase
LLRISGGVFNRRRLVTVKGQASRPSAARLREAWFAILEARGLVQGAQVLDICAGSGVLGLEALSRGAALCTFIEKDWQAFACLGLNVDNLGLKQQARLIKDDFRRPLAASFDLILADPPYDQGLAAQVPVWVEKQHWLSAGGMLAVEHSVREEVAEYGRLRLAEKRRYGQSRLSFFEINYLQEFAL